MEAFFSYIAENAGEIGVHLLEHIVLTAGALALAAPIGIAAGLALTRPGGERFRVPIFYLLGLGQTIPSLAILAFAVTVIGIGWLPAALAVALYAILPIARNTAAGIAAVPAVTVDAARGMGMTGRQILTGVEIPLAAPFIMAGVRTASLIAISAATLADLIGAGGMGHYIFSGIALFRPEVMLAGAIPVTLLALGTDRLLELGERNMRRMKR